MGSKKLLYMPVSEGGYGFKIGSLDPMPAFPEMLNATCLHIPVCFESHIPGFKINQEISNLEENLKSIQTMTIYVSINGNASDKYVEKVTNLTKKYKANVFRRPNTGFQWGGYFDVFTKYEFTYNWFATLEVDCRLNPKWREIAWPTRHLHHIGMHPFKTYGLDAHLLKDQTHTRGGFHLCSRPLLQAVRDKFNCFTESKGCNPLHDGIILGEIGFCTKILAAGYPLNPIENICWSTR